jgi:hypothetical protein
MRWLSFVLGVAVVASAQSDYWYRAPLREGRFLHATLARRDYADFSVQTAGLHVLAPLDSNRRWSLEWRMNTWEYPSDQVRNANQISAGALWRQGDWDWGAQGGVSTNGSWESHLLGAWSHDFHYTNAELSWSSNSVRDGYTWEEAPGVFQASGGVFPHGSPYLDLGAFGLWEWLPSEKYWQYYAEWTVGLFVLGQNRAGEGYPFLQPGLWRPRYTTRSVVFSLAGVQSGNSASFQTHPELRLRFSSPGDGWHYWVAHAWWGFNEWSQWNRDYRGIEVLLGVLFDRLAMEASVSWARNGERLPRDQVFEGWKWGVSLHRCF